MKTTQLFLYPEVLRKLSTCYLYVEVLNVDYTDIIYMSNMLKVYELFCLYLFVVLNLGRMNEMRDCNLKFGVVTLYYIGVIRNRYYLFLVLFICWLITKCLYIFVCCCALIPILSSIHVLAQGLQSGNKNSQKKLSNSLLGNVQGFFSTYIHSK